MTPAVQSLSVAQLRDRLALGEQPVILDVREPWEVDLCALPQSMCVPMGELPARIQQLPKDRDIVVLCHHGMRSLQAAHYLAGLGFERLYNLAGGIDAWAREVDPNLPLY